MWAADEKNLKTEQESETEEYYLDKIPYDDNHIPPGLEERLYSEEQASNLRLGPEISPEAVKVLPETTPEALPQSLSK